jgi:hypothetical protein
MPQTIEITDVGAINHVTIPIPEDGGFVVLKGTHGVGKSTALKATESLASGNGAIDKRDGAIEGRVSGFGATLSVKKVVRRSGQPEIAVDSLAGRLSLADIVDPHIKDPVAADAHRIKALLQIAGAKPEPADFYELVGGEQEFKKLVGEVGAADAVELAAKVRRQLAKAAREAEASADKAAGEAQAHRKEAAGREGIELRDPAELQADLEDAIRREAEVKNNARYAAQNAADRKAARIELEAAKAAYSGPTVADAQGNLDNASNDVRLASQKVAQLTKQLVEAQQAEAEAERAEERAEAALKSATDHCNAIAAWEETLKAPAMAPPDEGQLAGAAEAVAIARQEIERQAIARKAKQAEQSAVTAEAAAKQYRERAAKLRQSSENTDEVLTSLVGKLNCPLRVKHDRLVLDTDRGEELFADLSHGERYAIAFDIAIPQLPVNGLLTLSQAAYGELAPATRRDINAKLKARGVVCLTAEATDDEELHAEVFGG